MTTPPPDEDASAPGSASDDTGPGPSSDPNSAPPEAREPLLWEALVPVAALIGALGLVIGKYKEAFGEDARPALIVGIVVAALVCRTRLGMRWKPVEAGMVAGIKLALPAVLILMVIGCLIGVWIASGVVPVMIHYGLQLLSPAVFLPAACVICALVSLALGSSWTTASTVGVALIGVAGGLGVSPAMAAGAIISGAYFGDKMSPLSDTTNLAPAVAGSELFAHIRHMVYTTGPSILIALVLFALLGLGQGGEAGGAAGGDGDGVGALIDALDKQFDLGPALLLPIFAVFALVLLKVPALPALAGGVVVGGAFGMLFQDLTLVQLWSAAAGGPGIETGLARADELLNKGGLDGMWYTISLILMALSFGGIMERSGMLAVITRSVIGLARGTGSLVATTAASCFGMNVLAADQYLAIVLPGRMYKDTFARRGLDPKNLSRVLEDVGTLTSPLIFWNTCGATMAGALGVSAGAYWCFAFFNLINPVVSIVYGFTGWTMVKKGGEGK